MIEKSFADLADSAINETREGLTLLIELDELQAAATNMQMSADFEILVREIIEKQKIAIGLIQRATRTSRDLISQQSRRIELLCARL